MTAKFTPAEEAFHDHLAMLDVPLFALGERNRYPRDWQSSSPDDNDIERAKGRRTRGICAALGGQVAVVDIDTKNVLDPDRAATLAGEVRASLEAAGVQIYAVVESPSVGGYHLYVACQEGQPTLHANKERAWSDFPGVEVIAANANVYLPGTRRSKYQNHGYTIELDNLEAVLLDDGAAFTAWVAAHSIKRTKARQEGASPSTANAPTVEGLHPYVAKALAEECATVAATLAGGQNAALNTAAIKLGHYVGAGVLREEDARAHLYAAAEANGYVDRDGAAAAQSTIRSGLEAGKKEPKGVPDDDRAARAFGGDNRLIDEEEAGGDDTEASALYQHHNLGDAHLAERVARYHLRGHYLAWGRNGWAHWDGRKWDLDAEIDTVRRAVVEALRKIHRLETERADEERDRRMATDDATEIDGAKEVAKHHSDRMRQLAALFTAGKIDAVMKLARGFVQCEMLDFDRHPDLLNVGNGVINLRTGELGPHDPELMLSRITETCYVPGASHKDWDAALSAVREDVTDWLQIRFGQAATGYPPDDDVVPFLKGGGANGKSTLLGGVTGALGEHATLVPDKVLLGMRNEHTTELVPLYGARFAYIEELPEGDYLEEQRLKKAVGSNGITARRIGENNFTWTATHSLMLTTNYDVKVKATDHGTWRRLALVTFPNRYNGPGADSRADPGLRPRVERDPQVHEAVLAWLVEGARRWYEAGDRFGGRMPPLPPSVAQDTKEWQERANDTVQFMSDYLELDAGSCVLRSEVYEVFRAHRSEAGKNTMSDQTFWERAAGHQWFREGLAEIRRKSIRTSGWVVSRRSELDASAPAVARVVTGIRWIPADEDPPEGGQLDARLLAEDPPEEAARSA